MHLQKTIQHLTTDASNAKIHQAYDYKYFSKQGRPHIKHSEADPN